MSTLPSDLPKLAKWPFFLADALLLATAAAIAWNHSGRLSGLPFYVVAGCVALAAILGTLPLLADYARAQDLSLDERQRALDALSRTVASSAEQVGIVAGGLSALVESSQKALAQSEELSKSLQKKVAAAQQQIESAQQEELEELERELATLRNAEADRLEASVEKIHKVAAELAKLEATASRHLSLSTEAMAKAQAVADGAAGRLSQAADESASKMSAALDRSLAAVQESSRSVLGEEQKRVLDAIGSKLDATLLALDARSSKAATTIEAKIATLEAVVANLKAAVSEASRLHAISPAAEKTEGAAPIPGTASPDDAKQPATENTVASGGLSEISKAETESSVAPSLEHTEEGAPVEETPPAPDDDQTVVPSRTEVQALAAPSSETAHSKTGSPVGHADPMDVPPSFVELPSSPRKVKTPARDEPSLDFGEFNQSLNQDVSSSTALSADGATRLIVTAYIGIGNRLYIRGEGPGLNWDKGVPLQFVSIGKWRWETSDASAPVHFKLYKNDQVECAALGRRTIEPGHQAELAASF